MEYSVEPNSVGRIDFQALNDQISRLEGNPEIKSKFYESMRMIDYFPMNFTLIWNWGALQRWSRSWIDVEILVWNVRVLKPFEKLVSHLCVRLKWYVAAQHVVEKDPEGPNSGRNPFITLESYPFWWSINSSA